MALACACGDTHLRCAHDPMLPICRPMLLKPAHRSFIAAPVWSLEQPHAPSAQAATARMVFWRLMQKQKQKHIGRYCVVPWRGVASTTPGLGLGLHRENSAYRPLVWVNPSGSSTMLDCFYHEHLERSKIPFCMCVFFSTIAFICARKS